MLEGDPNDPSQQDPGGYQGGGYGDGGYTGDSGPGVGAGQANAGAGASAGAALGGGGPVGGEAQGSAGAEASAGASLGGLGGEASPAAGATAGPAGGYNGPTGSPSENQGNALGANLGGDAQGGVGGSVSGAPTNAFGSPIGAAAGVGMGAGMQLFGHALGDVMAKNPDLIGKVDVGQMLGQSSSANSTGPATYGAAPAGWGYKDAAYAGMVANGVDPQTAQSYMGNPTNPDALKALVDAATATYGLPTGDYGPLLSHLTWKESQGNPNTRNSPKGAIGIGQDMPATAKDPGYGLQSWNPHDVIENIMGSGAYLGTMIDLTGNVPGGLASYNAGYGAYRAAKGDISRMPAETQNYVSDITKSYNGAYGAIAPAAYTSRPLNIPAYSASGAGPGAQGAGIASPMVPTSGIAQGGFGPPMPTSYGQLTPISAAATSGLAPAGAIAPATLTPMSGIASGYPAAGVLSRGTVVPMGAAASGYSSVGVAADGTVVPMGGLAASGVSPGVSANMLGAAPATAGVGVTPAGISKDQSRLPGTPDKDQSRVPSEEPETEIDTQPLPDMQYASIGMKGRKDLSRVGLDAPRTYQGVDVPSGVAPFGQIVQPTQMSPVPGVPGVAVAGNALQPVAPGAALQPSWSSDMTAPGAPMQLTTAPGATPTRTVSTPASASRMAASQQGESGRTPTEPAKFVRKNGRLVSQNKLAGTGPSLASLAQKARGAKRPMFFTDGTLALPDGRIRLPNGTWVNLNRRAA